MVVTVREPRGYVETPDDVVDLMVDRLFALRAPTPQDRVLDPGCGTGAFIRGVIRWCERAGRSLPFLEGVELNPGLAHAAERGLRQVDKVRIETEDFLSWDAEPFDFIVGNPPYVPITEISEEEKGRYRALFDTAAGRFDLYLLFFERGIHLLKRSGRLVFISPEKFLYVETASPLRKLLAERRVEEIRLLPEDVFGDLVTYPTVTTVDNGSGPAVTRVVHRDGRVTLVQFPEDGSSWLPAMNGGRSGRAKLTLGDLCGRISCGVATGADAVFVKKAADLDENLREFARPTIAGRELTPTTKELEPRYLMTIPYNRSGELLPLDELGALKAYLSRPEIRARLEQRTCVRRKPWHAFHETPPLADILQPKILCKDITAVPRFWIDAKGHIVPRHSVYYIVPRDSRLIGSLAKYLNSRDAARWLEAHCQRAANGFLRLQSRILRNLPIPERVVTGRPGQEKTVHVRG